MKNNIPDISLIRKYLNGELDVKAMYKLERQAQDDPMLMDIILGMESADSNADEANLAAISAQIRKRVEERQTRKMIPWRTWTVAASLIFALSAVLWWFNQPQQREVIQQSAQVKTVEQGPVGVDKQQPEPVAVPVVKPPVKEKQLPERTRLSERRRSAERTQLAGLPQKQAPAKTAEIPSAATIPPMSAEQYLSRRRADSTAIAKNINVYKDAKIDHDSNALLKEVMVAGNKGRLKQLPGAATPTINGTVYDQQDGKGLPGVVVTIKGTKTGQVTDSQGHYSIPVTDENASLVFSSIGYNRREAKISKSNQLDITLAPASDQLSEVVVVGYGTQKKNTVAAATMRVRGDNPVANGAAVPDQALSGRIAGVQINNDKSLNEVSVIKNSLGKPKKAFPVNGWKAYKKYLEESAVSDGLSAGNVIVKFNLDTLGRPVNPIIIKGQGNALDEKAIRIILNGAGWIRGEKGIAEEIKLKLKFH